MSTTNDTPVATEAADATPATAPFADVVEKVYVDNATMSSFRVSWAPPVLQEGADRTTAGAGQRFRYKVEVTQTGLYYSWSVVAEGLDANEYVVQDLAPYSSYLARVTVMFADGSVKPASDPSEVITTLTLEQDHARLTKELAATKAALLTARTTVRGRSYAGALTSVSVEEAEATASNNREAPAPAAETSTEELAVAEGATPE